MRNVRRQMSLERISAEELAHADVAAIQAYNKRAPEKFALHPELGPSPFEGNIASAAVVLLLSNPGFDSSSTTDDHKFVRVGWPLAGLHPEAPFGLRRWWEKRLKYLIREFGAEAVSNRVAAIQLTPWASEKFDASLRLPSRARMLEVAGNVGRRGAVLIVMRSQKLWEESDGVKTAVGRYRVNSWRSSYVSPGNLSATGWQAVRAALQQPSNSSLKFAPFGRGTPQKRGAP